MKRLVLNIFLAAADLVGINRLFCLVTWRKVRVLMYHVVTEKPTTAFRWTVLETEVFRWQMDYIAQRFQAIQASAVWCSSSIAKTARSMHRPPVVITFDDGLVNTLTEAEPVLAEMRLPAVCFVLPQLSLEGREIWADDLFGFIMDSMADAFDWEEYGFTGMSLAKDPEERANQAEMVLGEMKLWSQARRLDFMNHVSEKRKRETVVATAFQLMSIEQIGQLANTGSFEIGVHSDSHPIMSSLSEEDQYREVSGAVQKLRQHGIPHVPVFAYPNGRPQDFNDATIAVLKRLDFKAGLTTIDGLCNPVNDPFRAERIAVGAGITRWEFKARVSGLFYFLKLLTTRNR